MKEGRKKKREDQKSDNIQDIRKVLRRQEEKRAVWRKEAKEKWDGLDVIEKMVEMMESLESDSKSHTVPSSGKSKLTDEPTKKWSPAGGKDDEPGHEGDQDGAEIITTREVGSTKLLDSYSDTRVPGVEFCGCVQSLQHLPLAHKDPHRHEEIYSCTRTKETITVDGSGLVCNMYLDSTADQPWLLNNADRGGNADGQGNQEAGGAGHAAKNIYSRQNDKDISKSLQFKALENDCRLEEEDSGAASQVDGEAQGQEHQQVHQDPDTNIRTPQVEYLNNVFSIQDTKATSAGMKVQHMDQEPDKDGEEGVEQVLEGVQGQAGGVYVEETAQPGYKETSRQTISGEERATTQETTKLGEEMTCHTIALVMKMASTGEDDLEVTQEMQASCDSGPGGSLGEQQLQTKRDELAWKEDRVEVNSKQFVQQKELPGGFVKLKQMFEAASSYKKKVIMPNTELVNMANENKATSGEVGRVMMSARKKVNARRASMKTIVIEKGFVQARIKKFMLSSEVGEEVGKLNNKRRLQGTQGDNMKSASKRRKEE